MLQMKKFVVLFSLLLYRILTQVFHFTYTEKSIWFIAYDSDGGLRFIERCSWSPRSECVSRTAFCLRTEEYVQLF